MKRSVSLNPYWLWVLPIVWVNVSLQIAESTLPGSRRVITSYYEIIRRFGSADWAPRNEFWATLQSWLTKGAASGTVGKLGIRKLSSQLQALRSQRLCHDLHCQSGCLATPWNWNWTPLQIPLWPCLLAQTAELWLVPHNISTVQISYGHIAR